MATASCIKDRQNRNNVTRLLKKVSIYIKTLNFNEFINGLFLFIGINEFSEEIFEVIIPCVKCDIFFYNCSDKFVTDIAIKYMKTLNGSIIFANGDECLIYTFEGSTFKKIKQINAHLQKRQKKGGSSSARIARLAEETRHRYVIQIMDSINLIDNGWLFGSNEITGLILEKKTDLNYGGFLLFNHDTIKNSKMWIEYLNIDKQKLEKEDKLLKQIIENLEINIDILDFDINNKNDMEYYMLHESDNKENCITLNKNNKYYGELHKFEYIGVKFFNYSQDEFS